MSFVHIIIPELTLYGETYKNVKLSSSMYFDNVTPALMMHTEEGEPLSKVTVNLLGMGISPAEGCYIVKAYAEGEQVYQGLLGLGVITPTGRSWAIGDFDSTCVEVTLADEAFGSHEAE